MAPENQNQNPLGANSPFWEFIRSMDSLGLDRNNQPPLPTDADHPPPQGGPPPPPDHQSHPPPPPPGGPGSEFIPTGFPFDGSYNGPWRFGGRGRHANGHGHGRNHGRGPRGAHEHRRHRSRTPSSSDSSRSLSPPPRPEEGAAREQEEPRPSSPRGDREPHPHWGGRRGRRGCHRGGPPPFGNFGYGGWYGSHVPPFHHRGPPPPPPTANWDPAFLANVASHPFVHNILQNIGSFGFQMNPQNNDSARNATETAGDNDELTFTPALDVFKTPLAYTLHVSLPGAKKEDIGVHYAATTSILTISGVIYRPGNEEFLATITSGERQVGMFEKSVVLKADDGGEVDGDAITAKLEDGVLIVTVPRFEREWENVKRVDIE